VVGCQPYEEVSKLLVRHDSCLPFLCHQSFSVIPRVMSRREQPRWSHLLSEKDTKIDLAVPPVQP
jgi:hypothetical protein